MLTTQTHRVITLLVLIFALISAPQEFLTNDLVRIGAAVIVGDLFFAVSKVFSKYKRRRKRKPRNTRGSNLNFGHV